MSHHKWKMSTQLKRLFQKDYNPQSHLSYIYLFIKGTGTVIPLQARCGQRVGRGIALLFHEGSTRRGWMVSSTPRPHFAPGKEPVPILQEAGWAPGPVWTGGKTRPHRDSIPDRPTSSSVAIPTELPGPLYLFVVILKCTGKGKDISVQTHRAPRISTRSAHAIDNFVSPTHRPALPPRRYSWYSSLLETGSTTGP